jgi:cytochrome c nitrite reductase small subunit
MPMARWWTGLGLRLPLVVLCALIGILLGLGMYTFWYAEGASYFSSNPASCVNCHIMREQYESWQRASHHAHASCVECHLPHEGLAKWLAKAENGFWHSTRFTLQDFHEPIRIHKKNARILQDNCVKCHEGLVGDLVDHGAFADESNSCVRCHSAVGHGPPR